MFEKIGPQNMQKKPAPPLIAVDRFIAGTSTGCRPDADRTCLDLDNYIDFARRPLGPVTRYSTLEQNPLINYSIYTDV